MSVASTVDAPARTVRDPASTSRRRDSAPSWARLRPWLLPLAALAIWEGAAHFPGIDVRFLPSLEIIGARAWRMIAIDKLSAHLLASLWRDLKGLSLGAGAGLMLGLVFGFAPALRRYFGPMLVAQRQIALFAWVPLISMWFGGGEAGKVAFIAWAAFQPTFVNTWRGVEQVPKAYRELSDALLFKPLEFVRFIAIPYATPQIFTGLHAALIYAWTATIGAELLFNVAPGVGAQMNEGLQLYQIDRLLFCILLLGSVGVAFNLVAKLAERRLIAWRTP